MSARNDGAFDVVEGVVFCGGPAPSLFSAWSIIHEYIDIASGSRECVPGHVFIVPNVAECVAMPGFCCKIPFSPIPLSFGTPVGQ